MSNLEQTLEEIFVRKLPPMSAGAKETTARVIPWIMIIFGGLGILMWLSSLRFVFGFSGLYGYAMPPVSMLIYMVIAPIVQAVGIYGGYLMLSRRRKGWTIALYMLLVGLILHLLSISILGLVLDILFAYLLFQTKEYFAG